MKTVYGTIYYFVFCTLLIACNQTINASIPTLAPSPTQTPSPTTSPTATRTPYREPTLIPTIEPEKIPALLNNLSVETLNAFNGHNLQRITGWSNGFNGGMWDRGSRGRNHGYLWMDASHLLLFPATGETLAPNWSNITARPVVMNINTGKIWLPPVDRALNGSNRWFNILLPRWSSKLQVLVTGENVGQEEGTSTFTADGERISHYKGQLIDISPSAEKIFVNGDTWIDLMNGKEVNFGWGSGFGEGTQRWFPIWSRGENQIYFCCYYYGNAKTGKSYTISNEKKIFNEGPFNNLHGLRHTYGIWLNDHTVMAQPDVWWYGSPGFIAIFDVKERTYHNFGAVAGLPDQFNSDYPYYSISPNRDYMFMFAPTFPQVYLIDLATFKSEPYDTELAEWSTNGKYALIGDQVLTLSDKTLRSLPAIPDFEKFSYWIIDAWHPTAGARLIIYADKQKHQFLYLLDIETLTYRHLALPSNFDDSRDTSITWSPNGDRFVLAAADGSLWQMDYPKLENLQQLTPPIADVKDISWSPDGRYLSYVGGADIYIMDVESNP